MMMQMMKRMGVWGMITAVSLLAVTLGLTLLANAAPNGEVEPLVVSAAPDPVQRGELLTYTVTVTNNTTNTQRITLTSDLPTSTLLQDWSPEAEVVIEMGTETAVRAISETFGLSATLQITYTVFISDEASIAIENVTTLETEDQTVTETLSVTLIEEDPIVYLPFILVNQCSSDQNEPNNDPAQAGMRDPLPQNMPLTASFCGDDDDDWYQIVVDASREIEIDLTVDDAQDLDLFLYESTGNGFNIIGSSNFAGFGTDERIELMVTAGTYYIRVFPFMAGADDSVTYQLRWTQP